jgi:serine/threonine protein phosphatase 1
MTYCVSDIHGCYEKFMELLDKIQFTPSADTLYVLGDAIDRGEQPVKCLMFIKKTNRVHFILGNHEHMMLDHYDCKNDTWRRNGNETTKAQLDSLRECERGAILSYIRTRPYYKTLAVNGKRFFLSHSGLAVGVPFKYQTPRDMVWNREGFYRRKALKRHTCIFGHTPTSYIRHSEDDSVWFDSVNHDKIGIDCGCVYGGYLAAYRLDDGAVFYC